MSGTARSRLPAQVVDFLEEFANTGNGKVAAVNVGVHPKVAERFVRETMDHAGAREAFDQIMRTRFSHAGPIALNLLIEMVEDKRGAYSGPVRLEAAKSLLDRSGYTAKAMLQPQGRKDLNELSRDELLAIVNAGEAELADRAKQVGNAQIDVAIEHQVIDLEG